MPDRSKLPSEQMRHITDPKELMVGREYWVVEKLTGKFRIETLQERDNRAFFGMHIWAIEGNNQAMDRWDVFGPIPERQPPDFNALRAQNPSYSLRR